MASDPDSWPRDRVLWLVVAVTTAARLYLAWRYFGFLGGDDVEILEETFRVTRGLDYHPWEIRNLFLPYVVVSPFVRLGSALGLAGTFPLTLCATLPFIVLASVNVVLVYLVALRWLGDRATARTAMTIYAFHWLPLALGGTVYPRTVSTTFVLGAVVVLSRVGRHTTRGVVAGTLVALACAVRYSEGIFLLPVGMVAMASGENRGGSLRRVLGMLGGFVAGTAVAAGLFNAVTWGDPLASLEALARFMLLGEGAEGLSTQPPLFYLQRILFWLPPTLLPALVLALGVRRARPAWAFVAVPLVIFSLVHHKELRYLQGAIPFFAIAGAAGFAVMRRRWSPGPVTALVVLTLASEVLGARILAGKSMAAVSAARAMASERGVKVVVLSQAWAYGGRLYFGNGVEVRDLPTPPRERDVEERIPGADRLALYRRDLEEDPALAAALARHGFVAARQFSWGRSKTVVVFGRK